MTRALACPVWAIPKASRSTPHLKPIIVMAQTATSTCSTGSKRANSWAHTSKLLTHMQEAKHAASVSSDSAFKLILDTGTVSFDDEFCMSCLNWISTAARLRKMFDKHGSGHIEVVGEAAVHQLSPEPPDGHLDAGNRLTLSPRHEGKASGESQKG